MAVITLGNLRDYWKRVNDWVSGVTADAPKVTLSGSTVTEITFHSAAVAAGPGNSFAVSGQKTLLVEIEGTSTSRQISFKGAGPSGVIRDIAGVNLATMAVATSTTGNNELWSFDITGLKAVMMYLASVSGGDVTVRGRAVA